METKKRDKPRKKTTRRLSAKDIFFKELSLECVVYMNYHSGCEITSRSHAVFEKGADKLFNQDHKFVVANSANQPGFVAYGNSSIASNLQNIAFKNIRKKTRKVVIKQTMNTIINPLMEELNFLEQFQTIEPDQNNLIFSNPNDEFIQKLTVLIELYNIQNKPSEILEEIRVLVSDKIEKIKNKIEQVETFIKNKPFKKLNNVYKQKFYGKTADDFDSFGTIICPIVSDQLITAVQYFMEDFKVVEFSNPMDFIQNIYSYQNFILRKNNYLYQFIEYLLKKTKNLKALTALDSLSQDFDDTTDPKTTSSKELVRFLLAFIKFSDIILLNSSCLSFTNNLKQQKIEEIGALVSQNLVSSNSTDIASSASSEFQEQLDTDVIDILTNIHLDNFITDNFEFDNLDLDFSILD